MNQRTLPKAGINISEIGFGAWAIGGSWGETVDEAIALEAIEAALADGVNFIDTADVYGGGRSETLIGKILPRAPHRVYVATKMGRGPQWSDDYASMEKTLAGSMRRLGVDVIDLVQLHCIPTATLKNGRALDHLEKLKARGLIAAYGASVETIDEGLFCISHGGCASLQVIYNLFRQRLLDQLLPEAAKHQVGIIARVPLASGLLTGKFKPGHQFHAEDHRHFNANGECFNVGETFAGLPFEEGVRLAGRFIALAAEHGISLPPAQLALRWLLDQPAVTTVIPGGKNAAQVHENNAATTRPPLTTAVHQACRELYREAVDAEVRGPY
jgi:aryl-alcohol dehydrogenase-like predicted oxidoreductase